MSDGSANSDNERATLIRALKSIEQAEAMILGLAIRSPESVPIAKALVEIKRAHRRLGKIAGLKRGARIGLEQRRGGIELLEALHRESLTPPQPSPPIEGKSATRRV